MRWKVFCLILGIAILISCSEQSIDENLPTAQNRDGLITEAPPLHPIILEQPAFIDLVSDDSVITVGGEFTTVHAIATDEQGSPVGEGYIIRLEITAAPAMDSSGPSFEHVPFDSVTHVVEKTTDFNGQASVVLFSGTRAGTVRIKATWVDDETVFREEPLIQLIAGPPAHIAIGPSNVPEPDGDSLIIGLVAIIWDEYTNPVTPDSPIQFEAIPDSIVTIIEDTSFSRCWLVFHCEHTFDTIRFVGSYENLVDTCGPFILSLWDGNMNAEANPDEIYIDAPQTCDTSIVAAQLQSGLDCPIRNGGIIFQALEYGEIVGQTIDTTDIDGFAHTLFQICYEQIPVTSSHYPSYCMARIVVRLLGYPDVEGECEIYCRRVE